MAVFIRWFTETVIDGKYRSIIAFEIAQININSQPQQKYMINLQ